MIWDWTPGERISKLPKSLQWPALIWRNLYFFPQNLRNTARQHSSPSANEICRSLTLSVEYISQAAVEGDVAEFGTMTGRTATILAKALSRYSSSKQLLLFDSFRGLPETQSPVDREAPHVREGVWSPGSCRGLTKKQLAARCRKYLPVSRLHIYEGWFSKTLPAHSRSNPIGLDPY